MVRYAKLPISIDLAAVKAELTTMANGFWKPHFNTYHYTGNWTVLALRSPGGSHTNIIPDTMGGAGYADTEYMANFPAVKKLTDTLMCPVNAVRFLNLQAGAVIKKHTDKELAFEKGEARLHFPIITNPAVEFYCEDNRLILQEGSCWYLNANLPHQVANYGDTDRIHLVIDCQVNDWLKNLITSAPEISHKPDVDNNSELLKIIEELRLQNSETSNRLANEMEARIKVTDLLKTNG